MRAVVFAVVFAVVPVLDGCSWFLPKPTPTADRATAANANGDCSLELMERRKNLARGIDARGLAALLVVRLAAGAGADRRIRAGDAITFVDGSPANGPAPRLEATDSRGGSTWVVEGRDRGNRVLSPESPLSDGVSMRLRARDGSGYLLLAETGARTVPRGDSSRFILLKADAPDPARPSTCDGDIRDGDYVFLRLREPGAWVGAGADGALRLMAGRGQDCDADEERCYTDAVGGLVCAWTPECRAAR